MGYCSILRPQNALHVASLQPPNVPQDASKLALGMSFQSLVAPSCSLHVASLQPPLPQDASKLALGMSFQSLVAPSCSLQVANLQPPMPPRCKQVGPRHVISITCCALPFIACCQPTAPKPRCKQVGPRHIISITCCGLFFTACCQPAASKCPQESSKFALGISFQLLVVPSRLWHVASLQPPFAPQDAR